MNITAAPATTARHGIARLYDVFTGVQHALGEERFDQIIDAHAAGRYDPAMLIEQFPAYLRDRAPHLPYRNFLVQLATLELTLHHMRDSSDEHGDQLRLLRFDYPVSDYLRAVEQLLDDDDEVIGAPVATRRCWVAVYRHGSQIGRMTVSPAQFNNVLDCLTQREPDTLAAVAAAN